MQNCMHAMRGCKEVFADPDFPYKKFAHHPAPHSRRLRIIPRLIPEVQRITPRPCQEAQRITPRPYQEVRRTNPGGLNQGCASTRGG